MRIAITGCNGSVGTRVVLQAIKQRHSVVGLDVSPQAKSIEGVSFHQLDLTNYDELLHVLDMEKCEAIVHLAGIRNPEDYKVKTHNNNVIVSWNMLTAAATLGIKRIAQASSVNIITLVFSHNPHYDYFPIDEDHPTLPDEPYGLSKLICEAQADAIIRRNPDMRIASLRLHYSVPSRKMIVDFGLDQQRGDLWGYVQEDSSAEAFLKCVTEDNGSWSGHEAFYIAAPRIAFDANSRELMDKYWPGVPVKEGKSMDGNRSFFDCSKAERLLGWIHTDVEI